MAFKCDQCGACCRNLDKSSVYAELDSGGGVCKYLKGNLCSIYSDRPLICRVDEFYDEYLKEKMSREEYYQITYGVCKFLKNEWRD